MYNFNQVQVENNIRTKFKDVHDHKTTGNTGDLMPIYYKEILPGDFVKMDLKTLVKMTTPNFQTMDTAFCDIFFFFTPRRLVWKNWKQFMGEKSVGPHEVEPEYTIPKTVAPTEIWYEAAHVEEDTVGTYYTKENNNYTPVSLPSAYNEKTVYYRQCTGWAENTIADYLGIPTKIGGISVDSAYFRTYALICNEWFRDQNRMDFCDFSDDDANSVGSNGTNYVTDVIGGGKCFKAAKLHDYFTSSLLTPTGREQVLLPLGESAPVIGNGTALGLTNGTNNYGIQFDNNSAARLYTGVYGTEIGSANVGTPTGSNNKTLGITTDATKSGIITDLSNATAATVNQLRLAFQLQKIFEHNNIRGNRYIEQLKTRWNVTPSDATLQRPEYLGGKRFPINVEMVVQTGSTDNESPLGQISGFSNTYNENTYFSKQFEEHGILMGLAVIRHQRTYQQGLSRFFTRTNMEDFYTPEFQNLGEQNLYNYEIFATGTSKDNETFGYQEYGAEYRSTPNRVSGQFRSNATNSFDNWHYADDYETTPVNGEEWICENVDAVNRTLTVSSEVANQFYFDFHFEETNVRTMPPHSMPGFIDHH